MLIVSPFHDYYDGALGTAGVDKTIVYRRKYYHDLDQEAPIKIQRWSDFPHYSPDWFVRNINANTYGHPMYRGMVIFCGKAYPFLQVPLYEDGIDPKQWAARPGGARRFIYNNFMSDNRLLAQLSDSGKKAVEVFSKFAEKQRNDDYSDLNKKYQSPALASFRTDYGKSSYTMPYTAAVNPCLAELEFFKVFNSFDAFQEIYYFIGNVLTNNEDPPDLKLDEKTKLLTKGMDNMSFKRREHPRKSKRNKT